MVDSTIIKMRLTHTQAYLHSEIVPIFDAHENARACAYIRRISVYGERERRAGSKITARKVRDFDHRDQPQVQSVSVIVTS